MTIQYPPTQILKVIEFKPPKQSLGPDVESTSSETGQNLPL